MKRELFKKWFRDEYVADIFSLTVLLCDDFLRIKCFSSATAEFRHETVRFFDIAQQLPIELQMVLSHRTFDSSKEFVGTKDSEPAFKNIFRYFMLMT